MRKLPMPLLAFIVCISISQLYSQTLSLNVVTARGKATVFADTVYAAKIDATVATSNGYIRMHFTSPNFDGAFNVPLNYQGILGVDSRIQPTFVRKDAHFTGVVTIKREKDKLILLTMSPKDAPEQESEIYKGLIGDETREQKFSGEFRYQTYTYDEQKFVKRDFIVQLKIEMPISITWNTIMRNWVPENLPKKMADETEGLSITDAPLSDSLGTQIEPVIEALPVDTVKAEPVIEALPVDTTEAKPEKEAEIVDTTEAEPEAQAEPDVEAVDEDTELEVVETDSVQVEE